VAPDSLPPNIRKAYLDPNELSVSRVEEAPPRPDADREGFDPADSFEGASSFGDLNLGGILGPLRQLSYWTMKKRARSIGEGGMYSFPGQAAAGHGRSRHACASHGPQVPDHCGLQHGRRA
jgi:hypothetical protein